MGSSRQDDRSLSSGLSLPMWMKGKAEKRFELNEGTFSPPSHDDSFFYIRYPKAQSSSSVSTDKFIPSRNALNENSVSVPTKQVTSSQQAPSNFKETKEIDYSKHPLPCQPFVPVADNKGTLASFENNKKAANGVLTGNVKPAKSLGTDDGFHGTPALCAKSIVHVANQMMSNRFNKPVAPESQGEQVENVPSRVSKSLPVTPLASPISTPDSSPKARRKAHANRYFTGPFLPDRDKYQGGWILSSILGQSREIVTSKIDEEEETVVDYTPPKTLSRKKSISSQNLTYIGADEKSMGKRSDNAKVLRAKPSELREMNFWSPTSM